MKINRKYILFSILIIAIGGGFLLFRHYFRLPKEDANLLPTNITEPISKDEIADWESYQDNEYGFKIKYPSSWTKEERVMGRAVNFLSPKENELDTFQESVNVVFEDISWYATDISLDKYVQENIDSVKESLHDFKEIDSSTIQLDNLPAYKIVFMGTRNDNAYLKWLMIFTIYNKKAYLVTYTAGVDKFPEFIEIANEIINSFEITRG